MEIHRLTYHTRRRPHTTGADYIGSVRVHHAGGSYVVQSLIRRLSRDDARTDAARIGRDILFENFAN